MIRFVELFAGIGGFRLGLENANQEDRQHLPQRIRNGQHTRPIRNQSSIEKRSTRRGEYTSSEDTRTGEEGRFLRQQNLHRYLTSIDERIEHGGEASGRNQPQDPDHHHRGFLQEAEEAENIRRNRTDVKEWQNGIEGHRIGIATESRGTDTYRNEEGRRKPCTEGGRRGIEQEHSGFEIPQEERDQESWTDSSNINRVSSTLRRGKPTFSCVWANDNNKYICQIYRKNFGEEEIVEADIRTVDADTIPDHDLLTAGFPCPSFSTAGQGLGFKDPRGTLFYEILRVAKAKKPRLLLLENVKGLLSNDRGQTFLTILEELGRIGYWCEWQTLNSKWFGVPQNRPRVFIMGHRGDRGGREIFPITAIGEDADGAREASQGDGARVRSKGALPNVKPRMDNRSDNHLLGVAGALGVGGMSLERNLIAGGLRPSGIGKGNPENLVANTISQRYHKDGSENLIGMTGVTLANTSRYGEKNKVRSPLNQSGVSFALNRAGDQGIAMLDFNQDGRIYVKPHSATLRTPKASQSNRIMHNIYGGFNEKKPRIFEDYSPTLRTPKGGGHLPVLLKEMQLRRFTPLECERLQGFPDGWTDCVSDTQRYKALGNAVTVNVIEFLGRRILEAEKIV